MDLNNLVAETGKAQPLGASLAHDGVNFSIFSRNATAVTLIIFESAEPGSRWKEIPLSPTGNKTGNIWHCFIKGLEAGTCYLYRADGPFAPEKGQRFNVNKVLLDPYTKALTDTKNWDYSKCLSYDPVKNTRDLSFCRSDSIAHQPRCIVIDDTFDWEDDKPLNYPLRFSVIYETHVKGLTAHSSSGVQCPGTYRGVIEKFLFLKTLELPVLNFCLFRNLMNLKFQDTTTVPEKTDKLLGLFNGGILCAKRFVCRRQGSRRSSARV